MRARVPCPLVYLDSVTVRILYHSLSVVIVVASSAIKIDLSQFIVPLHDFCSWTQSEPCAV